MGVDSVGGYRETGGNNSGYTYNNSGTSKTSGQNLDMVFTDKSKQELSMDDFLNLMVMQMKNQDFTNPMDDSQMLAQMAQFASMQAMQELTAYSKQNYVSSLLGQTVTAAKFAVNGDVEKQTGKIQKISLANNEYAVYINGQKFSLEQIMELGGSDASGDMGFDSSTISIEQGAISDTWAEATWEAPTGDQSTAGELKYSLYYSTTPIKTVETIEKDGTLAGSEDRPGMTSGIILGLKPGTTYYVNVIVKDSEGNKSCYKMLTVTTTGKATGDEDSGSSGDGEDSADDDKTEET